MYLANGNQLTNWNAEWRTLKSCLETPWALRLQADVLSWGTGGGGVTAGLLLEQANKAM